MIKQMRIENFRGFEQLDIALSPITLIGGKNNVGKTTLLESIMLPYSYSDPNMFLNFSFMRNMNFNLQFTAKRLWEPLFTNFQSERLLKIQLIDENEQPRTLQLTKDSKTVVATISDNVLSQIAKANVPSLDKIVSYPLNYSYEAPSIREAGKYFLHVNNIRMEAEQKEEREGGQLQVVQLFKGVGQFDPMMIAQWVGELILKDKKDQLIAALQLFDKAIVDLQTIVENNIGYIYVSYANGFKMPINYMGDGILKLLYILISILANPGSILLIDEMENGFHYSMYNKVWATIGQTATEMKCQIIANTHNRDFIQGAIDGLKEAECFEKFSYVRLEKNEKMTTAHVFSNTVIEYALDSEMEVR